MDPAGSSRVEMPHRDVQLCFAADVSLLPLARSVAASIARQVSPESDYVNAVRLSTNELVATLLTTAKAGSMARCQFRLLDDELRVSVTVQSLLGQPPEPTSSQVTVLDQLVESASTVATPAAGGGYEIRSDLVILTRERSGVPRQQQR